MRLWIFATAAVLLVLGTLTRYRPADPSVSPTLAMAATEFLAALSPEQRGLAQLDYDSERRVQWHFIPMETRKGLPLKDMSDDQKSKALQLLKTFLSQMGYDKSRTIMSFENILRELEGPASHERRNSEKYYFAVYGQPSSQGLWGASFEGHHLSLNFVVQDGQIVDSTPQVFAANPAELPREFGNAFPKGLRILRAEEELGFALLHSLSEQQKNLAIIADTALPEVRWAGEPQPKVEEPRGIKASQLNEDQKTLLRQLIATYTGAMREEVAKARWSQIEDRGFDEIHFAWAGPDKPGIGHYYCIQGPTFIIEFVNTQPDAAGNPANHIHCIWRDMQGDFHLDIEPPSSK